MELHEVQIVSNPEELEKVIALRHRVLRAPWNQPYDSARDDFEDSAVNAFVADPSGNVVACGRLQRLNESEGQVRYMAVADDWQGTGLGRKILAFLEMRAGRMGFSRIVLQARENAVEFYRSRGYVVEEKTFLLWGVIQHYLMSKRI